MKRNFSSSTLHPYNLLSNENVEEIVGSNNKGKLNYVHKIYKIEEAKVIQLCDIHKLNPPLSFLDSWNNKQYYDEIIENLVRKLNIFYKNRWGTFINTMILSSDKFVGHSKRNLFKIKIELLSEKIREKIIYELLNPVLCKFIKSKTPTSKEIKKEKKNKRAEKRFSEDFDTYPDLEFKFNKKKNKNLKEFTLKEELNTLDTINYVNHKNIESILNLKDKKLKAITKNQIVKSNNTNQDQIKLKLPKHNTSINQEEFITIMNQWKQKNKFEIDAKVYVVIGQYPDIRMALLSRGWVENTDSESDFFDFKWTLKQNEISFKELQMQQKVNHFQLSIEFTTKNGLLHNLTNFGWYYGIDINKFFPICYDLSNVEIPDFFIQFKIIKAESILKQFVKISDCSLISPMQKYSIICSIIITERRVNSFDSLLNLDYYSGSIISNEEWDIITSCDYVQKIPKRYISKFKNKEKEIVLQYPNYQQSALLYYSQDLLSKLKKNDPQFNLNGEKNMWIAKPAGKSRGRGIALFTNLKLLMEFIKGKHYVVQKYIENPLIIQNRKFDIRQWVLITNWNPLTIWFYEGSYIRFSSEDYLIDSLDNKFIHLTNNSISKKSSNNPKFHGNMWFNEELENYLDQEFGNNPWINKIKPKIKKIIIYTLLSVEDRIINRENSYELYGYDFMIDNDLNVWLIEVNSSPALDYSTEVTEKVVKSGLEDLIKVVIDYQNASPDKKSLVNTGQFIKIYEDIKKVPKQNFKMSFADNQLSEIKVRDEYLFV